MPTDFFKLTADISVADKKDFYYRFHFLLNILKTLGNTGIFNGLPWQAVFLFAVLTSCQPAAKSISRRLFTIQAFCLKLYTSFYIPSHLHTSRNIFTHLQTTTNNYATRRRKRMKKVWRSLWKR